MNKGTTLGKEAAIDILDRDVRFAIDKLYSEKPNLKTNCHLALDAAIDGFDNWIDVRDDLPKKNGYYIVTREYFDWGVIDEVRQFYFDGKKWLTDFGGVDITSEVIAWKKGGPYKRREVTKKEIQSFIDKKLEQYAENESEEYFTPLTDDYCKTLTEIKSMLKDLPQEDE